MTGAVQTYPATQELQSPTPKFSSLGLKSHLDSAHGAGEHWGSKSWS